MDLAVKHGDLMLFCRNYVESTTNAWTNEIQHGHQISIAGVTRKTITIYVRANQKNHLWGSLINFRS